MKLNYFLFAIILLLSSCVTTRIYKQNDDFENQKKYKLEQSYYAKKDFSGSTQVTIAYYKTISSQGNVKLEAQLLVYSSSKKGELQEEIGFKLGNEIYKAYFYDYEAKYGYDFNIDYSDNDAAEQNVSGNVGDNIRHIAYFDLTDEIVSGLLSSPNLQVRFYIGKEAYTISFSKAKLKQFKKLILLP